jgi:hypothetical protein
VLVYQYTRGFIFQESFWSSTRISQSASFIEVTLSMVYNKEGNAILNISCHDIKYKGSSSQRISLKLLPVPGIYIV